MKPTLSVRLFFALTLFAAVLFLVSTIMPSVEEMEGFIKKYPKFIQAGLEVLKTVLLIGTALFAVVQWRKEQRWKRRSLVLERVEAFGDTPGAYNAQLMLQGRRVKVPLWDRTVSKDPYTLVDPEEVAAALLPEKLGNVWHQNDRHDAIRNSFNDYLGRLADIQFNVSGARVLKDSDIKRLRESIRISFEHLERRAPLTAIALREYMGAYGYSDVTNFIKSDKRGVGMSRLLYARLSQYLPRW
ncbi:MAG TPA: hypothetical protein VF710_09895 [Longimicrobium sp.]|jgi:hypothetical protein